MGGVGVWAWEQGGRGGEVGRKEHICGEERGTPRGWVLRAGRGCWGWIADYVKHLRTVCKLWERLCWKQGAGEAGIFLVLKSSSCYLCTPIHPHTPSLLLPSSLPPTLTQPVCLLSLPAHLSLCLAHTRPHSPLHPRTPLPPAQVRGAQPPLCVCAVGGARKDPRALRPHVGARPHFPAPPAQLHD